MKLFVARFVLVFLYIIPNGTSAQSETLKIGNDWPYSGPASLYLPMIKTASYYFNYINETKAFPRKVVLVSLDNESRPPKALENARKLVDKEKVDLVFMTFGTPWNAATWDFYNKKKVPHLLIMSGAREFHDPKGHPFTVPGIFQSYYLEGKNYGKYIATKMDNPKVAVLYQNENFGKDYLAGLKDGLGALASKIIVAEQSYELTDPTVDSQILNLQRSGANILCSFSAPKMQAQAIKKIAALNWKLKGHFIASTAASIQNTFIPAGLAESKGIISSTYFKDPNSDLWKNDKGITEYLSWCQKWAKDVNCKDTYAMIGYSQAQILMHVLNNAKSDLSRENIMKHAISVKDLSLPLFLNEIIVSISDEERYPVKSATLMQFDGKDWKLLKESPKPAKM